MGKQPITAQLIKELRDRTGIGMGKCKEALEQAGGDIDEAIANLRKQGLAQAAKKQDRAANEGMIAIAESDGGFALVEINSETDFVAKNDRFLEFAKHIAEEIAKTKPKDLQAFFSQKYSKDPQLTVDQYRGTLVQVIGENIQIKRFLTIPKEQDKSIGLYQHLGGKLVCAVEIKGSNTAQDLAKEIAMHIAAASPDYLSPEKVPQEVIAQEQEIARGQVKGKPPEITEKIVKGKVEAFFDSVCLLRQKFIKDDSQTIQQLVNHNAEKAKKPLSVVSFIRWSVGD